VWHHEEAFGPGSVLVVSGSMNAWQKSESIVQIEGVQSIVMSMSVCLSARMHIYGITNFTRLSVHVACGPGSVLLVQNGDTLCTSGFVNDIKFSYNQPYGDIW